MSMVCLLSCMLMRVFFVLAGLRFFSEGDLGLGWAFVASLPLQGTQVEPLSSLARSN